MKDVKTLPTGTIAMSDVNVELRRPWNQQIDLNNPEVRRLAGRPSGQISMGDLRGKSNSQDFYTALWLGDRLTEQKNATLTSALTNIEVYVYRDAEYSKISKIAYRYLGGLVPVSATMRTLFYDNRYGAIDQTHHLGASTGQWIEVVFNDRFPQVNSNTEVWITLNY